MNRERHWCDGCWTDRKFAPLGIAILVKRGQENMIMKRLNVPLLSINEMNNMLKGKMAYRHFYYKDYCQDFPISYE